MLFSPAHANAEDAAAPSPAIRIQGNNWRMAPSDIENVLRLASDQILRHFPGRKLGDLTVSHWESRPKIFFDRGPRGDYRVMLSASEGYWAQYTYQFTHELTHVLSNYDRIQEGKNEWFEEALCETASLFVLSRMRRAWETTPPPYYSRSWGINFERYLDDMLAEPSRKLPADTTMARWLELNLPALTSNRDSDRALLVAAHLLPIFQDNPEGWEALNWVSLGADDGALDFAQYLQGWHDRVPEKHKKLVRRIQQLFGYEPPPAAQLNGTAPSSRAGA
ncbi:hypothetical protein [Polyangium aurulentum]|uniref:hypothetical protein n=1 Tax=Polyangium aurulentum TaxID=2567896 RepID=UPI0010AEA242|nr:hypothetical protein [Polyangium aurulentum]UQA59572.1 hypothetical protein E8A73_003420 [Polyangium aurulentum]